MGGPGWAVPAPLGVHLPFKKTSWASGFLSVVVLVGLAACFSGSFRQQLPSAVLTVLLFLFDFALFLLPGFVLASVSASGKRLAALQIVVLIVAASATLGLFSFWAFFFSKLLGRIFSFSVYIASAGVLLSPLCRRTAIIAVAKSTAKPFLYAAVAGVCYLCFLFLFVDPVASGADYANQRFFDQIRPGDNIIPFFFAEKLYARQPLRPFCCGDWLSSDRPPLQTGIFLLQRTLRFVGTVRLHYELIAAALQCLWICGVWCLLTSFGTPAIRIRQALGLLIFSGFLFYNSVYAWPKLLAAACVLFIASILIDAIRRGGRLSFFEASLSAACVGLALMAHPGSIFSLPAIAVGVVRFRRTFSIRQLVLAACIVSVYGVPWIMYQKIVDPPGNRLVKMHLAGDPDIDKRSTWRAIVDAYTGRTAKDIIAFKLSNVLTLEGHQPLDTFGLEAVTLTGKVGIDRMAAEQSRIAQREWIWNAVGVLNLGWLAWLMFLLRRKQASAAIAYSGWMIAAALGNCLVWSLATFGPNATVTTHSSYADILLLSVGLIGFVLTLPRVFQAAIFSLQVFNLLVIWVWSPHQSFVFGSSQLAGPVLQWPLLLVGGLLALALILHFGESYISGDSARE